MSRDIDNPDQRMAIAGLWHSGKGTIIRPSPDQILFLPQRPYLTVGTWREQLLYPHTDMESVNALPSL